MTDTATNFDPIPRLQQIATIIKESSADIFYAPTTVAYDIECAIKEIERLRKELDARIAMCDMRSEKIGELANERDEARQEICESHCDSLAVVLGSHITPQDYAQRRGWDCFKKKTLKDCLKENTNG